MNIIKNIIANMDKNSLRKFVIHNLDSDYFYDIDSDDDNYFLNRKSWEVYCKIWYGIKNAFPGSEEVLAYDEVSVGKVANVIRGIDAAHAMLINNEVKVFYRGDVIDSFDIIDMSLDERINRICKSIDRFDVFFFTDGCSNAFGFSNSKVIGK